MEPLRHIAGVACPIALANVDTDQILPARFLQRPRSEGHGPVLFHDMRFDAAGKPRPEFPLNRPAWTGARDPCRPAEFRRRLFARIGRVRAR